MAKKFLKQKKGELLPVHSFPELYEIFAILFREAIGSFCRGWLSFQVKWPECKGGGGGQCVRVEGGGEFRYSGCNTRIRSYRGKWSMPGNGTSRSKGCCLPGYAINSPLLLLFSLPPSPRSSSFEPMLVSRGSCRSKIIRGSEKKKNGRSIEFFFFFLPFFRKMERNLKNLRNIRCSWKNSFNQHAIVRDFF